jgi:DNA-binding IclR family transcriptional regulator
MPVKPSPSVKRAAQILKLLAAEPRTELTLSELARRAGLNRASCQTLLLALASSGLVTRCETGPTYKLGLELVALGEAARMATDVVSLAQAELIPLRNRFQASGMAGTVSGGDIAIFTVASRPHPLGYSIAAGSRLTFRAPVGLIYVAWAGNAETNAWFDRATPPLTKAKKDAIIRDLERIRSRGWSASARSHESASHDLLAVHEVSERELGTGELNIAGISAPVFDSTRRMVCSLALTDFATMPNGSQIGEVAAALKQAADRISRQLGGVVP